jgi:raffinose/stachyose/melibiose transport system permease protein
VLFKIILPLVKNTFATVFLIHFIQLWNNYSTPLLYLRSFPTIAYGVYHVAYFISQYEIYQMAIAMLVFIPMLVVFAIFNGRLMGNLTMGGLKG